MAVSDALFLAVNHIAMEAMAKFIDELPSKIFHSYVKLQMVCDSVVYVIVYAINGPKKTPSSLIASLNPHLPSELGKLPSHQLPSNI